MRDHIWILSSTLTIHARVLTDSWSARWNPDCVVYVQVAGSKLSLVGDELFPLKNTIKQQRLTLDSSK